MGQSPGFSLCLGPGLGLGLGLDLSSCTGLGFGPSLESRVLSHKSWRKSGSGFGPGSWYRSRSGFGSVFGSASVSIPVLGPGPIPIPGSSFWFLFRFRVSGPSQGLGPGLEMVPSSGLGMIPRSKHRLRVGSKPQVVGQDSDPNLGSHSHFNSNLRSRSVSMSGSGSGIKTGVRSWVPVPVLGPNCCSNFGFWFPI